MTLYVVRHGETEANTKDIKQGGDVNGPLTENGVRQIKEVALKIPRSIEIIYASPSRRVLESANILNEALDVELIMREALNERDFGSIAGHSFDEFDNGAELLRLDESLEYDYRSYGGESAGNVMERVSVFLGDIRAAGHESALAVTSRGVIMMLYKILHGRIVTEVPNGSLHYFENRSL